MISINFYITPDKENVINKIKNSELILDGTIKESSSIYTPSIRLKYNENILTKNYCYIGIFNRFYFITDIVIDGREITVSLRCDVLESFKQDFMPSTQVIARQQFSFNKYLSDDRVPAQNRKFYVVKKFGNSPFSTNASIGGKVISDDLDRYNFILVSNTIN